MNLQLPKQLTIKYLHDLYASGKATPADVVEAILDKCRQYSSYHIWIRLFDHQSIAVYLEKLEACDFRDKQRYPLWGIPFAIKDNIDLAGVPTTAACPEFGYTPKQSATVVALLLEAGAIPIGKTNMDQFATGLVGTRSPYGECHNAYEPSLISGGSSSGSAVSVALGLVGFALGTDTAGSGRVPAALNNIIGFKPPLGSWSTRGVVPACASLDCVTVFAQSLADVAAVNRVASVFDPSCAWSALIDPTQSLDLGFSDNKPLPTVYLPDLMPDFFGRFASSYRDSWLAFTQRIEHLGKTRNFKVKSLDTRFFSKIAAVLYDGPWVAERWSDLGSFVQTHPDALFPVTKTILESGTSSTHTAADLFTVIHNVAAARQQAAQLLKDAVLIMPTTGGTFTRSEVRANPLQTNSLLGLYTNHCNLCDLSAIAIPANMAAPNLPFGVTIFASRNSQQNLMQTARAIEVTPV